MLSGEQLERTRVASSENRQRWWLAWMAARVSLNYCFWYAAFVFLAWLNYERLEALERVTENQKFLVFAATLPTLATLVLAMAAAEGACERARSRWLRYGMAAFSALAVAWFYADLLLFRFMAIHVGKGLRVLTEGGWQQFLLTVEATGVRPQAIRRGGLALLGICVGGAVVVRAARRLSERSPLRVTVRRLALCVAVLAGIALGLDYWGLHSKANRRAWLELKRVMPLQVGLWQPAPGLRFGGARLRRLRTPPETEAALAAATVPPGRRPDIFMFILESVRGDYLNEHTTPHLAGLRAGCLPFADTLAGSDATHVSWYSLVTGNHPLYFAMEAKARPRRGGVPLRLLQRAGYQIHALAANYLSYHALDQLAFGEGLELAASLTDARQMEGLSRPERDRRVTKLLLERLEEKPGGRVFLVLYDSTHHDYYWPPEGPAPFAPYAPSWDYGNFSVGPEELERIKNRYRNALHFVDSQFGEVLARLKATGQYDDAVILVTGDHGEEFLEHGKMVHASETCRTQTYVPIYLKLPKGTEVPGGAPHPLPIASHVDVLPTLLDFLGMHGSNLFDGESLFRKSESFAIMAEQNGSRDPYQFCLQADGCKAWFQYRENGRPIRFETEVYLQKLTDAEDRPLLAEA